MGGGDNRRKKNRVGRERGKEEKENVGEEETVGTKGGRERAGLKGESRFPHGPPWEPDLSNSGWNWAMAWERSERTFFSPPFGA